MTVTSSLGFGVVSDNMTGNTLVSRDSSGNSGVNSLAIGTTSTVSSGSTINLYIGSAQAQVVTGTNTQLMILPQGTSLVKGWTYLINNNSTGLLTVQTFGGGSLTTVVAGAYMEVFLTDNSTSAGTWDYHYSMPQSAVYGTAGLSVTGYLESSTLTASAPVIANSSKQLTSTALTSGQLLIGNTGTVPSAATLSNANGIHIVNGSGSITLSNLRDAAQFVVSPVSGQAGYTTISAAITAAAATSPSATSPALVLVWSGSYTENLTLVDYVYIVGMCPNSVQVTGNVSYSSGSGVVYLFNLTFTNDTGNIVTHSASSELFLYNCNIVNSGSGYCFASTAGDTYFYLSQLIVGESGYGISIQNSSTFNECQLSNFGILDGQISSVGFDGILNLNYCTITDSYTVGVGNINAYSCQFITNTNLPCIYCTSAGASLNLSSSYLLSSASNSYAIDGSASFTITYDLLTFAGSANAINPLANIQINSIAPPIISGLLTCKDISSAPSSSASSSLALGTAYQNTLGYDVMLIVYIAVTSATSASILCGVGSSGSPTQQTIVSSLTLAALNVIPVTVYLPNNYYAKISTSGTITASISGQQVTPV